MRANADQSANAQGRANRVRCALDAKAGEGSEVTIERLVVPEAGLATANAPVSGLDRVADAAVPLGHRARVVRHGPAAAHLVQAIALARLLVVPGLHEHSSVVVSTPIAGIMYAA